MHTTAVSAERRGSLLSLGHRHIPKTEMFRRFHVGSSSGHEKILDQLLPKPINPSGHKATVPEYEVEIILLARTRGDTDDQIRALVRKLHELRGHELSEILKAIGVEPDHGGAA